MRLNQRAYGALEMPSSNTTECTRKVTSSSQIPSTSRRSRRRRKPITSSSTEASKSSTASEFISSEDLSNDCIYDAPFNQKDSTFSSFPRSTSSSSSSSSSSPPPPLPCKKSLSTQTNSKNDHSNYDTNETTNDKENHINYSYLSHRRVLNHQKQDMSSSSAYETFLRDTKIIEGHQSEKEIESHVNMPSQSTLKAIFNASFIEYPKFLAIVRKTDDTSSTTVLKGGKMRGQQINNVINLSRKCIRGVVMTHKISSKGSCSASSHSERSKPSSLVVAFAQLRLAIHCIKSILPTICIIEPEFGLMKQVIKLLYHLNSVVEDIFMKYNKGKTATLEGQRENQGSDGSQDRNRSSFLLDIVMLSVSCYQILGVTLKSLYDKESEETIPLIKRESEKTNNHDICGFFPVPCIKTCGHDKDIAIDSKSSVTRLYSTNGSTNGSTKKGEDLPNKQIMKIAIHVIISTSFTLWNVYYQQLQYIVDHRDTIIGGGDVSEKNHNLLVAISNEHLNQYGHDFCSDVEKVLNNLKPEGTDIEETDILKNGESFSKFFCMPFRLLLCQIAMPWIIQLSLEEDDDNNTTNDDRNNECQSFVSRITKLLFDSATKLEKIVSASNIFDKLTALVSEQSLLLRQDSVMLSLLFGKDLDGQWVSYRTLSEKTNVLYYTEINQWKQFEKASWNASNISTNFANQMNENNCAFWNKALKQFHQVVGAALDSMTMSFGKTSLCYIEYCAHRALHISAITRECGWYSPSIKHSPECVFCQLPFPYSHSKENPCQRINQSRHTVPDALISLYYVSVLSKNAIIDKPFGRTKKEYSRYLCLAENAIQIFRSTVLHSERCVEDTLLTCQRTLSKLKLISFVVDVVKKARGGKRKFDPAGLFVIGRILGECLSPLNYLISKKLTDERHKFLKIALESYLRAGCVLDTAAYAYIGSNENEHEDFVKDCFSNGDRYISKCGTLSCNVMSRSEHPYLESIAKVCRTRCTFCKLMSIANI